MRTPGLGLRTYLKLLKTHTPRQLMAESATALAALGLKDEVVQAVRKPDWTLIEQDLSWLEQNNHLALTLSDPGYPRQLIEIADPPPVLFVRGNPELLSLPQIAMVGSRNPSALGIETAISFAQTLASHGFAITSGLALGIDAASHRGALKAGGYTIAVAGTGLDRVYPARHKDLATEIVRTGAMISEFPPGTTAKANHFPRRNRIISGLCLGLLVVEAAKQSGSLISARLALEQNREVFAIPGSIHNPLARGCNALIREGAKLVETTRDILDELGEYNQRDENFTPNTLQSTLDLEQQTLLNLIMFSPTSIDKLVETTGQSVEVISSMLLVLELQGFIEATAGGCYTRIK
ncbi:MAG: DNA-processing protein DprA [Gammaproteobacteria bacterium]